LHRHAVLDRVAGIGRLDLGVNGPLHAGRDAVDPHQRRLADRLEDVAEDALLFRHSTLRISWPRSTRNTRNPEAAHLAAGRWSAWPVTDSRHDAIPTSACSARSAARLQRRDARRFSRTAARLVWLGSVARSAVSDGE